MLDLQLLAYINEPGSQNLSLTAPAGITSPVLNDISMPLAMTNMVSIFVKLNVFATNSAVAVLNDSNGGPKVAVRDFGTGHVMALAMCDEGNDNCLLDAGVQKLIANAANWH